MTTRAAVHRSASDWVSRKYRQCPNCFQIHLVAVKCADVRGPCLTCGRMLTAAERWQLADGTKPLCRTCYLARS